ncbi:FecR domain-containing protein [uncultured Neptuniibacter sp.]|uniref:FecR domain-containing protein n=1 Tax=uncultured Neptuniibacter sp. TaxID=502143 RepID=UPI0026033662|nr:FecR domain-containing protein [uncultured Neptuniibacter sp.]
MQPGETIWSIAHELLTDWRQWQAVEKLNHVRNDRKMPPGTVLKIPRSFISEYPSDIKIIDVSGTVTAQIVMRGEARAHLPLVRGQSLGQGDIIKTADNASVLLEFDDGTQVLILENSRLRIEQATVLGSKRRVVDIKVFLEEGEAEIRSNPAKVPGSQFLIDTPAAFATTKGTTYRVRAKPESTMAEVTQGVIGVGNAEGAVRVAQGFGTVTEMNQRPKAPEALLPAPNLPEPPAVIRYLPGKMEWRVLSGAAHYRSQISVDSEFSSIHYDELSNQPKVSLPVTLQDGVYWLRVSGLNPDGLQGFNALKKLTIDARPFPPVRQLPRPAQSSYVGAVSFSWTRPDLAASFRFELSKDRAFSRLVISESGLKGTEFEVELSEPGEYFWRVTSVTESGEVGPVGFPGEFLLKPIPPIPELKAPVKTENELFFSWQPEEQVVQYEFQMGADRAFKEVLFERISDAPEVAVDKPEVGTYYIRVRSLDADHYAGAWSEPQRVVVPVENWWPVILTGAASLLLML